MIDLAYQNVMDTAELLNMKIQDYLNDMRNSKLKYDLECYENWGKEMTVAIGYIQQCTKNRQWPEADAQLQNAIKTLRSNASEIMISLLQDADKNTTTNEEHNEIVSNELHALDNKLSVISSRSRMLERALEKINPQQTAWIK